MLYIHDNEILSYTVDLKDGQITLITASHNQDGSKEIKIIFYGVLAHYFENELSGSIIFDIEKSELTSFIKDNTTLLEKRKNQCWPIYYKTLEELKDKLEAGRYSYYAITSSYGLSGWVLAKDIKIVREDEA